MTRIVLASSSPRRRELLARIGVRFSVIEPPDDGAVPPGVGADLAVQLVARNKAMSVAATQPAGTFVLGADTMVLGPKGPLGKPHTAQRAREMLDMLNGCRHTVLTGVCAIAAPSGAEALGVSRSAVRFTPQDVSVRLDRILPRVQKPARYTGGEWGCHDNSWDGADVRWALIFPDVYEVGMSYLGFKILYQILNEAPGVLAERAYSPWVDMEREMRGIGLPMYALESRRPLR